MQIFKDLDLLNLKNTVITTGNFDGVHLGHQFLLRQLVSLSKERNCKSVVVMFFPHPREVLSKNDSSFRYLSSQEDKYAIFEQCNIDIVVEISFSKELAKWTAEDFVKRILLDKLGMSLFLVGYDHRLGNPKSDTHVAPLSEKYGFEMLECSSFETSVGIVSSSVVREHVVNGDVIRVRELLGRLYSMKTTVVEGKKVGRTIGFPTANLVPIYSKQLLPAQGVYVVQVKVKGEWFGGMLQVGHRPTLDDGRGITVEVHVFDFDEEVYGHEVEVRFFCFLRENQRFANIDFLQLQLQKDESDSRKVLLTV